MKLRIRTAITASTAAIPTPLAGLALGLSSLGWCWEYAAGMAGKAQQVGALAGGMLLLAVLLKFLMQPRLLWQELSHPVLGSVLPTFAMASMVISAALPAGYDLVLWSAALVMHLIFLCGFIWHRLQDLRLHLMIPGWFIPPVGVITAALTIPSEAFHPLVQWIFWAGLACYSLLLPVMLLRLLFAGNIPENGKPTIAVLAAPASLLLAGYLTITPEPSVLLVSVLLGIAILMTALIYLAMVLLLRLPFSPGFAAYTFPLVIGATALFKVSMLFGQWQMTDEANTLFRLAQLELVVATLVTAYVCIRYIRYFLQINAAPVSGILPAGK